MDKPEDKKEYIKAKIRKYGKNWRIDVDDKGGGINFKAKRDLPKNWWKKLTGKQ